MMTLFPSRSPCPAGHSLARLLLVLVGAIALTRTAFAARAEELARIHLEAIGGGERVAALKALRASGEVVAGGKSMHFTILAARPDRVRIETENGGRTLVQASDGVAPAWEFDTGDWPPRYREMPAAAAKTFTADAEFDDPLVAGPARGFTLDYAGEVEVEGKKLLRILVTRHLTQTFALLLDPETFLIVRRLEQRPNPLGGMSRVLTLFADYRPVQGVLVPHKVALLIDGQMKQQTQIESIQANPTIAPDAFSRPKAIGLPPKR